MSRGRAAGGIILLAAGLALAVKSEQAPAPIDREPADYSSISEPSAPIADCMSEDGSGAGQQYPCYWDGKRMGNGKGSSYFILGPGG